MTKLELVEMALQELGDVSAQELSAFIEQKKGVKIEPKFIPVFKASLRDRTTLEAARHGLMVVFRCTPSTNKSIPQACLAGDGRHRLGHCGISISRRPLPAFPLSRPRSGQPGT
jgi:hypothetical protein